MGRKHLSPLANHYQIEKCSLTRDNNFKPDGVEVIHTIDDIYNLEGHVFILVAKHYMK